MEHPLLSGAVLLAASVAGSLPFERRGLPALLGYLLESTSVGLPASPGCRILKTSFSGPNLA